jgi:hypothetical protein
MSLLRCGPPGLLVDSAIGLIPHLAQNAAGFLDLILVRTENLISID